MPAAKRTSAGWTVAIVSLLLALSAAQLLVAQENANQEKNILRVALKPSVEKEKPRLVEPTVVELKVVGPKVVERKVVVEEAVVEPAERNILRLAQTPKNPPPPSGKAPPAPPPPGEAGPRDPTTVRPDLRPILDPPATSAGAGSSVPQFKLRGRVAQSKGKAGGILDINGQLFMIQEGTQIDTVIGTGTEITVNIRKFSAEGVVLEVEQTGKTIRLR